MATSQFSQPRDVSWTASGDFIFGPSKIKAIVKEIEQQSSQDAAGRQPKKQRSFLALFHCSRQCVALCNKRCAHSLMTEHVLVEIEWYDGPRVG